MTQANHSSANGTVIYAIGDVHGEAERLRRLHDIIRERHGLLYSGRALKIIHLGDYVDRGPDSAGVIEAVRALEDDPQVACISLRGNHEEMMLDALDEVRVSARADWVSNGGDKTLASYETCDDAGLLERHREWLRDLPSVYEDAARRMIFVHAGIHPLQYPKEPDATYRWTRSPRFFDVDAWRENEALAGWTVVHGHTPTKNFFPEMVEGYAQRVNIDTGAVYGGRLTAAVFAQGEDVKFLYA